METMHYVIWGAYGLFGAISLVLIIYLAVRRLKIRKKENFEKRDN